MSLLDRLPALLSREFREFLIGSAVSNTGKTIQMWIMAWHVYAITNSSLMVGLLGLVRVVPLALFSLFGGVVADHSDRRIVLIFTQGAMMVVAILLTLATTFGFASIGVLYTLVVLHSIARAFDGPARQSMVVSLVPTAHFPNAVSINAITWRASDVVGPFLAGVFLASPGVLGMSGIATGYAANALCFVAVLIAVFRLGPKRPTAEAEANSPKSVREVFGLIKDGVRFVHGTPVVRQAMFIDFWATFFSAADALLPAFAKDIFELGPTGYGVLAASIGAGSMIAAGVLAFLPTIRDQGRWVVAMVGVYGLCTLGFGLSPNAIIGALFLAGTGAADMISTVMRQTIRQLATPDAMRGRMSAYSSLFFMCGPQLGDAESGLLAKLTGERAAVAIGGAACLGVAGLWSQAKELVNYRHSYVEPDET